MLLRHSDVGRQCYCATLLISLCPHPCITATARGRGALERHDGTQHAAGEPHKFCTQTIFTDDNKPAPATISTQQCYAEASYGLLADAAVPT
jgi:hypothetical protein